MENLKFILFIEIVAILVIVLLHLMCLVFGGKYPLEIYLFMPVIILILCLLTIYVIAPLAEWIDNI